MTLWKNIFPWLVRDASGQTDPAPGQAAQESEPPQEPGLAKEKAPAQEKKPATPGARQLPLPCCLAAPHVPDPFGTLAPPLTRQAVELSLSLAEMTYSLDITPWMAAGWQDFSFLIDDVLESSAQPYGDAPAEVSTPGDAAFQRLASLHRMRRAQSALRARNPMVQLMAALRQREGSDTVKAVCMACPLPGGQHLIAIGFMGTGKRFYDWFSNFRLSDEDGFHQGFAQLCRRFEDETDNILFPQTASLLGLKSLSLRDVISSMRSPHSPFRLWMAGHSQGGAVMQVFTHRLMHDHNVQPRLICGYGFASPTAATGRLTARPWEAPLWHIQNRDDLVPRIGAQMHLGRCAEYLPNEAFRKEAYRFSALAADEACRRWLMPVLYRIQDTADNLMHLTALILAIAEEKGGDALNFIQDKGRLFSETMHLITRERRLSAVDQLEKHFRRMYRDLTGHPMDKTRLAALKEQLRPHVAATPLRRILTCLTACLTQPHLLNDDDPARPKAYRLLAEQDMNRLRPYRWEVRGGSAAPVRRQGAYVAAMDAGHLPGTGRNHGSSRRILLQGKARVMRSYSGGSR